MNNRGILAVFSGPSGSGKGTVLACALEKDKNLTVSVSATTRAPREGEVHGKNYFFLKKEEFEALKSENGFLEYATFCDNSYGTPKAAVETLLAEGKDVVLEIEVQGALKVKEVMPEAVLIFNLPPSMEELRSRLVGRQTESIDVIEKRLKTAQWEMSLAEKYDYVLVNHVVEDTADAFLTVLKSEKLKTERNAELLTQFKK